MSTPINVLEEDTLTIPRTVRAALPNNLRRLYQLTSVVWALYAAGLALAAHGTVLLDFAEPGRLVLTALGVVVALGMITRSIVPGRPEWTRWTLPLVAGTSVATFSLLLFGSDFAGGLTASRLGFALLILVPAGFAYVHYLGERLVAPR